jgi:hypothetical protein
MGEKEGAESTVATTPSTPPTDSFADRFTILGMTDS